METIETRFKDVKGCDESKAELEEVVDYLREPKKFTDIGAALPKGALFHWLPAFLTINRSATCW